MLYILQFVSRFLFVLILLTNKLFGSFSYLFLIDIKSQLNNINKLPKEKSEEWKHVIILENNDNITFSKLCCISCHKKFQGGISRIKGHLIGDHKAVISKCYKIPNEI